MAFLVSRLSGHEQEITKISFFYSCIYDLQLISQNTTFSGEYFIFNSIKSKWQKKGVRLATKLKNKNPISVKPPKEVK